MSHTSVSIGYAAETRGVEPDVEFAGGIQGSTAISTAATQGVLYMAALTAIWRGSPFRTFYERMTQRGRAKKVALVAVMRKLLIMLNSIVRDRTPG